jgi:predicted histidine transporter YuiF (NhaC family)
MNVPSLLLAPIPVHMPIVAANVLVGVLIAVLRRRWKARGYENRRNGQKSELTHLVIPLLSLESGPL